MYHKMPLFHDRNKKTSIENNYTPFFSNLSFMNISKRKFALSSTKQKKKLGQEASYDAYLRASITLEMVVIMPLFICFMVFFLFLFRVLEVQVCMEKALLFTSRTLAAACYTESEQEREAETELLAKACLTFAAGLEESGCPTGLIGGGGLGVALLSSEFAGDDIVLRASYEMELPVRLLGFYSYRFQQCARSRKWIGDITLKGGTEDELWVYITPRGSVYHLTRTCSYLDLSIRAVGKASVGGLRNVSGGIYKVCESCGKGAGGTVFVTDYGDRYHSSLSCGGLKRTVYMVKISEAGGRNVCSKCGDKSQ